MKTAMQKFIEDVFYIDGSGDYQFKYIEDTPVTDEVKEALEKEKEQMTITENTSDGYHTFKELYEFRKVYNAALFNEWAIKEEYFVHKSWKHNDGELCFGGGWFIVVALLQSGQISNHYEAKDWDLFKIPERPKAMFEFDGHTAQDVLKRINETYQNK